MRYKRNLRYWRRILHDFNLVHISTNFPISVNKTYIEFSEISYSSYCSVKQSTDPSFYNLVLQALTEAGSLLALKQIHNLIIRNGFLSKSVFACRLVSSYSRFSGLSDAEKLFKQLPKQTIYTYNYMLNVYIEHEQYEFALPLYFQMLSVEIFPVPITFSLIIKACTALRSIHHGKIVHNHVLANGFGSDLYLATALLCLYGKCNYIGHARQLFDKMSQRDVFVWTSMISGYLQIGDYPEALYLFSQMQETGLKPNLVTWNALIGGFVRGGLVEKALLKFNQMQLDGIRPDKVSLCTILPAISHSAILKLGAQAHGYAIRMGLESDLFVISALIDMYAKCGNLALARCLFDRAKMKDIGLWNAILVSYGIHGRCEEVLQIFNRMLVSDVRPNEITFTSLFSACSHAGMVNEGLECFDHMIHIFGIAPCPEHYACIVDLLGRAGQLEEAYRFIESMPTEPTKDVWGALLSACRIHHNVGFAEIAAKHIFESIETSNNAGYHVMMSNVYAETGQWDDVAKLRSRIRTRGLKKVTGFSWIEVEGHLHIFDIADTSHSQSDQIYALLSSFESIGV